MKNPTLVVTNPPHEAVDVEAAAELLGMDVFTARLKAKFGAPEILGAAGSGKAVELAVALRKAGLKVTILPGAALTSQTWPDPVTHLAFDDTSLRVTVGGRSIEVGYGAEAVGVLCQPPADYSVTRPVDLRQAMQSGHGPTIAEAMQERGFVDLYTMADGSLMRVSIVPQLFGIRTEEVVSELGRRFKALRIDTRLAGVRPRGRAAHRDPGAAGVPAPDARRRGYSFGTVALSDLLGTIDPELRDAPQFELGSRIAYALAPLDTAGTP